jgi:hypothetical protein
MNVYGLICNSQTTFQKSYGCIVGALEPVGLFKHDSGYAFVSSYPGYGYITSVTETGDLIQKRAYRHVNVFYLKSAISTADGGVLMSATVDSGLLVMKLNSLGDTSWTGIYAHGWPYPGKACMTQLSDHGYAIGITRYGYHSQEEWELIRLDETGNLLWQKYYSDFSYGNVSNIFENNDHSMIVIGAKTLSNVAYTQPFLLKTDSAGNSLWGKLSSKACTIIHSVLQEANGDLLLNTQDVSACSSTPATMLTKIDTAGTILWSKSYTESVQATQILGFASVIAATNGGYIVFGNRLVEPSSLSRCFILKVDANGDTVWTRDFDDATITYANSIAVSNDSGYLFLGKSLNNPERCIYLYKTDEQGLTGCWQGTVNVVASNVTYQFNSSGISDVSFPTPPYSYPILVATLPDSVASVCQPSNVSETPSMFSMYPNPASDAVTIECGPEIIKAVSIYNVLGERLQTVEGLSQRKFILQVPSLVSGVYVIGITTDKGLIVQRLLINGKK